MLLSITLPASSGTFLKRTLPTDPHIDIDTKEALGQRFFRRMWPTHIHRNIGRSYQFYRIHIETRSTWLKGGGSIGKKKSHSKRCQVYHSLHYARPGVNASYIFKWQLARPKTPYFGQFHSQMLCSMLWFTQKRALLDKRSNFFIAAALLSYYTLHIVRYGYRCVISKSFHVNVYYYMARFFISILFYWRKHFLPSTLAFVFAQTQQRTTSFCALTFNVPLSPALDQ